MSRSNEQKLIDIMIECVLTVLDNECRESFGGMDQEEKAAWVARQLRGSGFHTVPASGSKWLRLTNKGERAIISDYSVALLIRLFLARDGVFVTNHQHVGGPIYELLLSGLTERISTNQRGKWYIITDLGGKWLNAHKALTED